MTTHRLQDGPIAGGELNALLRLLPLDLGEVTSTSIEALCKRANPASALVGLHAQQLSHIRLRIRTGHSPDVRPRNTLPKNLACRSAYPRGGIP